MAHGRQLFNSYLNDTTKIILKSYNKFLVTSFSVKNIFGQFLSYLSSSKTTPESSVDRSSPEMVMYPNDQ